MGAIGGMAESTAVKLEFQMNAQKTLSTLPVHQDHIFWIGICGLTSQHNLHIATHIPTGIAK